MKRAMASALAYLIFFEPVVRAAPNFRLAEEKLKKFDLGDLEDLDIHRKLNVPGDKSLRIEDSFIGTKSSGISGGRGQPNIINMGGGFPSDRLPDWRKQPKIDNKGDNLGKSVLDALYEKKDPTIACNARLRSTNPARYREISWKAGHMLPTVDPSESSLSLQALGIEKISAPVMEGVTDCTNTHKKACSTLLAKSISNPRQMVFKSKCDDSAVNRYEELVNSVDSSTGGLRSFASGSLAELSLLPEEVIDNNYELEEILSSKADQFKNAETCENQHEMTLEILAALDGNPSSKLAQVRTDVLVDLLRSVNPSAHEAVDCLSKDSNGKKIKLGGKKEPTGRLIGTLTGNIYREGGGEEQNLVGQLGLVFTVAAFFVSILKIGVDTVDKKKDREQKERHEERAHQRWLHDGGYDSEFGRRPGCDGNGSCGNDAGSKSNNDNQKNSGNKEDDGQKNSGNKEDDGQKNSGDKKDDLPENVIENPDDDNAVETHSGTSYRPGTIKIGPGGGIDPKLLRPVNNNPNNLHFSKGTEDRVCEAAYQKQLTLSPGLKHLLDPKVKFTTYSRDFEENVGRESDPEDYNSAKFRAKKTLLKRECFVQTWGIAS